MNQNPPQEEAEHQEAKMEVILMRRKLVALVKQQTQGIELLQTEVDRLRQKHLPVLRATQPRGGR